MCTPKCYGGLGLKDLRKWNDTLLSKHVWNIVNNRNSLWVKWVYQFHIKDRSFWDIMFKDNMSWTWKRFLNVRKCVRPFVVSSIGNGENTSLWHDWWHPIGIISMLIPRREWISKGFNDKSKVGDILVNGNYCWPNDWLELYPGLRDGPMFKCSGNRADGIIWRDKNGVSQCFSTGLE